jgi:hypothetical protein
MYIVAEYASDRERPGTFHLNIRRRVTTRAHARMELQHYTTVTDAVDAARYASGNTDTNWDDTYFTCTYAYIYTYV